MLASAKFVFRAESTTFAPSRLNAIATASPIVRVFFWISGRKLEPGDLFGQYQGADLWSIDLASSFKSPTLVRG